MNRSISDSAFPQRPRPRALASRSSRPLIARGDLDTPFIYTAYEQNSQWRVYGSESAAAARLVEESGVCETLKMARPDDWVQEVINAVEISRHERRWVSLPLDAEG